jgi:hypothetical protein
MSARSRPRSQAKAGGGKASFANKTKNAINNPLIAPSPVWVPHPRATPGTQGAADHPEAGRRARGRGRPARMMVAGFLKEL